MIRYLHVISLILGPLLGAIATFFWESDRYGVTAGVLIMLSSAAWIYGLLGVWERIAAWKPWFGCVGILITIVGTVGGIAFGLQGFFEGIFGLSGEESLDATAEYPIASAIVLWIPGPAFPLGLSALGIALAWSRLTSLWPAALLFLSGLAFPLSRISRTESIAHAADLLILVAFLALAAVMLRGGLNAAGGSDHGSRFAKA